MHGLAELQQKQLPLQKSNQSLRSLRNVTEQANSNEIWLLTLSDLLMLLMIFFVFLLAAPLVSANKPAQSQTVAKLVEKSPAAASTIIPAAVGETPDLHGQQAIAALADDLQGLLGDREEGQGVTVERRSRFVVITFPEQILFDSGQAQMKTAVSPKLEKVALFIINHPELSVEVQGHTDDRPIHSRRYPSNWELSADRATQVAKTLVILGANPEQLATKGFGEYHPLVPNTSDADRLKNRRVEIQFSLQQS